MANNIQSNPVYYSLASFSSGHDSSSSRTVVLHKRPDHDGFGVYIGEDIPSGLYIVTVERNSPASDANVQPGDRVLAVNGQLVSSMSSNPKEMLIKAATNAQSLTLTIQSTDIFQTLNLPLTNSYKDNNEHNKKQHSSKQTFDINTDLEKYIKSLLGNENAQIISTSNSNEFIIKSDPYSTSSMNVSSFPNRYHQSSGHKKERYHHHDHHRRPKRPTLETKETQTSIDDDKDENIPQEQLQNSSTRQYSTHPTMGTSQRILRTQQPVLNDNSRHESEDTNKTSDFTAVSSSPDDKSTYSKTNKTSLPASRATRSPTPNNSARNSTKNTNNQVQHMADIVAAAMLAKKQETHNSREQVSSYEPAPTTKRSTSPPPSRGPSSVTKQTTAPSSSRHPPENSSGEPVPTTKRATSPPSSRHPPENPSREPPPTTKRATSPPSSRHPPDNPSREPAPTTKRTTSPPSSRHPPENSSREPTHVTKPVDTPPQNHHPPPPYTETPNTHTSSPPVNNRESATSGSYNVRTAENQQATSSVHGDGSREVHLQRIQNFQGFGFHLQYNKSYYLVQRVESDSPAEQSGLHANDVIHSINQQTTNNMPHAIFVQIVNASSDVDFLVQPLDEYLRANPRPIRNQQAASTVEATINNDNDKHKTGLSKALSKLTSR